MQLMLEEEQSLQQLQDRERAIRQLEVKRFIVFNLPIPNFSSFKIFQSDIADVNTIFKDLATLVHEQAELVDSIEENVSSSQIRVQEGGEQLRLAEHYKVDSLDLNKHKTSVTPLHL